MIKSKNRYSFIFLIVLSFVFLFSTNVGAAKSFSDLGKVKWAADEIYYLSEKNIISGYPNGKFGPNDKITREQAALMLVNALYPNEAVKQNPGFTDVHTSDFYYRAIAIAKEKGIIKGFTDGTFRGDNFITRAETASMIDNAYKVTRGDAKVSFSDVPNTWYTNSVLDLASNKIVNGYTDGTFKPKNHVTRAEFSVILAYAIEPSFRPDEVVNNVPQPPESEVHEFVKQVVALTNEQRKQYGLTPLQLDLKLSNVAQVKSDDMYQVGYFDHNSPTYGSPFDMMESFDITYMYAGENIAKGYRTPEDVVEGWMNSPGHRANILNVNYTHIGVGFESKGFNWTQMFIGK